MKRNKNIGSGFSRFVRYFRNEMTGKEKNTFEKELQRDPFTEEAAEGFSSIEPGTALNDLRLLEKKLAGKTGKRNAGVLYRAAAAVAVLLVISSVFLIIDRKSQVQTEVMETVQQPLEIAEADAIFRQEEPLKNESSASGKSAESRLKDKKTAPVSAIPNIIDMAADSSPVIAEALEPEAVQHFRQKAEDDALAPAPASLRATAAKGFSPLTGIVVSSNDSMPVPEEDADELSEVVVVDYGLAVKGRIEDPEANVPPEPVNGQKTFDDYIRNNIRRPDSATAGQRVVVVTSFKVRIDGSVDSIRIVRSPEKKFSEEAIRLIKSGPAWKPAKRNGTPVEDEVRLRIVFH